jgi:hypothetical protein
MARFTCSPRYHHFSMWGPKRIPLHLPELETKTKVRRLNNLVCLCQLMELEGKSLWVTGTGLLTATKIPFMYSFSGNCTAFSPNFHNHVSLSDLYVPRISPHISYSRIGRLIAGIFKSLTDTWRGNWDCGRAIPFLGINVSNFRYCFFAVLWVKQRQW